MCTPLSSVADRIAKRGTASDQSADPSEDICDLRQSGLLSAPVSASARPEHALLETLCTIGRCGLPVGRLFEGHVNALQLIGAFGTHRQLVSAAADQAAARLFGMWNTEAADGVSLHRSGSGYRLSGFKTFASGAGLVERPLITARTADGELQLVLIRFDSGYGDRVDQSVWTPLGMRASASGKVDFTGIEVNENDLIGSPGDYHRQPWFSAGAVRFAAVQLGGAEALAALFRDHLIDRGRTGDAFQIARVAQAAMALETGRLWLRGVAEFPASDAELVEYVNLARSAIERVCLDVMELTTRGIGVQAMLRPHTYERILRDLTTYLRQPAPDAALVSVGRFILQSPGDLRSFGP